MTITLTTSATPGREAKGDGDMRRAEILDAAERIFARRRLSGLTLRKVADQVGVS